MNSRKLYNLLLDDRAKNSSEKILNLPNKFKNTCEQMPYLPQCKVYDI